jgi:predicted transcriptional regulator
MGEILPTFNNKVKKQYSIRKDVIDKLDELAKEKKLNKSAIVENGIIQFLKSQGIEFKY